MENVYTKPLSKYGNLMTVEEWKENVKSGGFIDYDGYGNAVKDNMMTERTFYPSQKHLVPKDTTHIMWYNR